MPTDTLDPRPFDPQASLPPVSPSAFDAFADDVLKKHADARLLTQVTSFRKVVYAAASLHTADCPASGAECDRAALEVLEEIADESSESPTRTDVFQAILKEGSSASLRAFGCRYDLMPEVDE